MNVTLTQFLSAFFPDEQELIWIRAFKAKDAAQTPENKTKMVSATRARLQSDKALQSELKELNKQRGIYFVVNSGGNENKDITRFNAVFAEIDMSEDDWQDNSRREAELARQMRLYKNAALQPSILTETLRGLSAFWLAEPAGRESVEQWKQIQARLIEVFNADAANKNEARLMRLPFFNHVRYEKASGELFYKPVRIVEFEPARRYALDELQAKFGTTKKTFFVETNGNGLQKAAVATSGIIPEKKRNKTLLSIVGTLRSRGLSEEAIIAAALADNKARFSPPLDESEVRDVVSRYAHQNAENANFQPGDEKAEPFSWNEPKPLDLTLKPVETIDDNCLPQILIDWLRPAAKVIGCPFDFLVLAAVVTAGSLIGSRLRVKALQNSDWFVVPNLYGGLIGLPSSKKSPATKEIRKPVLELQTAAREVYKAEKADYEIDAKFYEKESAKIVRESKSREDLRGKLKELSKPEQPILKRFEVNDATTPKLVQFLNENPNGLLLFRDELTGWLKSLEAEYDKSARPFFLEIWEGAYTTDLSRISGDREILLQSGTVSILGGIQPSKLQKYVSEAYSFDDSDGFLQRFLFSYPDVKGRAAKPSKEDYAAMLKGFSRANAAIKKLAAFDFGGRTKAANGDVFHAVKFELPAQEVIDQWKDETEQEAESLQIEDEPFSAYLSKLPKSCFAIALIFHCLENINEPNFPDEIRLSTALKAITYTEVLKSHARRVFALGENQIFALANTLLGKIKKGELSPGFKVREIMRKQWSGLKSKETVQEVVHLLVDYRYLRELKTEGDGRPTSIYFVHPSLIKESEDEN